MFVKSRSMTLDDTLSLDLSAAYEDHSTVNLDELKLIADVLGKFFYTEKEHYSSIRMALLFQVVKKVHVKKGKILVTERDVAERMYLISSGQVEVSVDGEIMRTLGRGALVGELGLMYEAPRSATVRCTSSCELWAIDKDDFMQLASIAAPNSMLQRGRWLAEVPELRALGSLALSVLVSNLESTRLNGGGNIYTMGEASSRCVLIESGVAVIELPPELADETPNKLDALLGIMRPPSGRRKDWFEVDYSHIISYLGSSDTKPALPSSLVEAQPECKPIRFKKGYHFVHEGCILGMGILFSRAGMKLRGESSDYSWDWNTVVVNNSLNSSDSVAGSPLRARTRSSSVVLESGAIAPYTCFVESKQLTFSFFSADCMHDLFGDLTVLLQSLVKRSSKKKASGTAYSSLSSRSTGRLFLKDVLRMKELEIKASCGSLKGLGHGNFKVLSFLASGSKSNIVLAESEVPTKIGAKKIVALKIMNKQKVVDRDKLRHTMDECKVLAICHSPFIATFQGLYQTDDEIVLCMEAVYHSDLHSIIQSTAKGLLLDQCRFYTASIVLALAHMHNKGISYRGLHPENVRIDDKGYIRIVDFAFAKQIPYLATDANGNVKINTKSYTLCGAPEYLAPECIFNTGANHAMDLWALGVITYEMHTKVTPFAVQSKHQASEMEVLQAVAATKHSGVAICSSWDLISGSSWKNFVSQLLKPEMNSRLGSAEKNTMAVIDHPFLHSVNKEGLVLMKVTAPFIPEPKILSPFTELEESVAYVGDQNIFNRFDAFCGC